MAKKNKKYISITILVITALVIGIFIGTQLFPKTKNVYITDDECSKILSSNNVLEPNYKERRSTRVDIDFANNPTITKHLSVSNICGDSWIGRDSASYLEDIRIRWLYDNTYEISSNCVNWEVN